MIDKTIHSTIIEPIFLVFKKIVSINLMYLYVIGYSPVLFIKKKKKKTVLILLKTIRLNIIYYVTIYALIISILNLDESRDWISDQ